MEDEPSSLSGEPQRIRKVPFTCTGGKIDIGDALYTFLSHAFAGGACQIIFELIPGTGVDDEGYPYDRFIRLRLCRSDHPEIAVVKQDEMMNFTGRFVTVAKPA